MKFNPKAILRHIAGATVSHRSEFSGLKIKKNTAPVSKEFIEKWVVPFYRKHPTDAEFTEQYEDKRKEIDDSIVDRLLGEFNWRMKKVGALFVAIESQTRCVEQIGNLMLRSEVCFAGKSYALALASLNTDECPVYLERYLSYYLKKDDLWFDQEEVLAALIHLDEKRGENRHQAHMKEWERFIINKPNWDLEKARKRMSIDLEAIETLKVEPVR